MQLFETLVFTANVPLTCISFLTTSLATTWSKMAWSLGSSIRQNLTRSLCHVSSVPGSSAVTVTCSRARVSPPCHHVPRATCAHLEDLVRGDAEPLGRVQELVLGDEVEGAASLGHQQSAGGGQQLPIVLWVMVVLVMRPSNAV